MLAFFHGLSLGRGLVTGLPLPPAMTRLVHTIPTDRVQPVNVRDRFRKEFIAKQRLNK